VSIQVKCAECFVRCKWEDLASGVAHAAKQQDDILRVIKTWNRLGKAGAQNYPVLLPSYRQRPWLEEAAVSAARRPYSSTKMFFSAHISFSTFGQTVTLTSPRCALRSRSIKVRD